jgi:hypothetical protein
VSGGWRADAVAEFPQFQAAGKAALHQQVERYTLGTYGHVIDELDGQPQVSAEDAIRAARTVDVRRGFAS